MQTTSHKSNSIVSAQPTILYFGFIPSINNFGWSKLSEIVNSQASARMEQDSHGFMTVFVAGYCIGTFSGFAEAQKAHLDHCANDRC